LELTATDRVTTFLEFLEMLGNSAKVREKAQRSANLCSSGNLIVAAQQNNLPVLYSCWNSFFIRDVHGEFWWI